MNNQPIFIPYKGDTQKTQVREEKKDSVVDLGHSTLLSCLYFLFDAFERVPGLHFFLVGDTAKKAKTGYMLEGDHVEIGVRANEWANDEKDILFDYFGQEHLEKIEDLPNKISFKWNIIPFTIHIYRDTPLITALVPVDYEHEAWNLPNNLEEFEKEYKND